MRRGACLVLLVLAAIIEFAEGRIQASSARGRPLEYSRSDNDLANTLHRQTLGLASASSLRQAAEDAAQRAEAEAREQDMQSKVAVSTNLTESSKRTVQGPPPAGVAQLSARPRTFEEFLGQHAIGRGINKWMNALDAYQRHFSYFINREVNVAEVGVQSGGSIEMWQTILGSKCHVYGVDINMKAVRFQNEKTSIVIGDQADVAMWQNFFANTAKKPLQIMVDDGGHEANQMLVTLMQTYEHLSVDGAIAIEDIHGNSYLEPFFIPAANFLAYQASKNHLSSVHMYPFLLVAQREHSPPIRFLGSSETVTDFDGLWKAAPKHPGGHVILENAGWGSLFTAIGIANFFKHFGALHESTWFDIPGGCSKTEVPVCTVVLKPNAMQSLITGIHIYADKLVVDVANGPPNNLQAIRRGTDWLPYG